MSKHEMRLGGPHAVTRLAPSGTARVLGSLPFHLHRLHISIGMLRHKSNLFENSSAGYWTLGVCRTQISVVANASTILP